MNSTRISQFSMSKCIFYAKQISYSESARKTESNDVDFCSFGSLRVFSKFHLIKISPKNESQWNVLIHTSFDSVFHADSEYDICFA